MFHQNLQNVRGVVLYMKLCLRSLRVYETDFFGYDVVQGEL